MLLILSGSSHSVVSELPLSAFLANLQISITMQFRNLVLRNTGLQMQAINVLWDDIFENISLAKLWDSHMSWRRMCSLYRGIKSALWNWLCLKSSSLSRLLNISHFLPASCSSFQHGVCTASVIWNTCSCRQSSSSEYLEVLTIFYKLSKCFNLLIKHIWSIKVLLLFIFGFVSCVGHFWNSILSLILIMNFWIFNL